MGSVPGKAAGARFPRHPAERLLRAVRGQRPSRRRQHPADRENPRRPEEAVDDDARDSSLLLDRRRRTGAADRGRVRPQGHRRRLDRQEFRPQRARDRRRDHARQAQQQRQRHRRRQRNHLPRRAEGRRPDRPHQAGEEVGQRSRHDRRNLEHLARQSRTRLLGRFHRRPRAALLGKLHRQAGGRSGGLSLRAAAREIPRQAHRHRRIRLAERRLQFAERRTRHVRTGLGAAQLRHPRRSDRHGIQHRRGDRSALEILRRRRRTLLGHSRCIPRTEIRVDRPDRERELLEAGRDRAARRHPDVAADPADRPAHR